MPVCQKNMKKITYSDVYRLGKKISIASGVVRKCWFPEVVDLDERLYGDQAVALEKAGRFEVHQIIGGDMGVDYDASMHSLWFDGEPVAIVRNAGWDSSDDMRRWITDLARFDELCSHIRKITDANYCKEVVDPETEIYPEELFSFAGGYWGDMVGIACEKPVKGIMILWSSHLRLKNAPAGQELVLQKLDEAPVMPEYIRREDFIAMRLRTLSDEDFASFPSLNSNDPNEVLHWFAPCHDVPEGSVVVAV